MTTSFLETAIELEAQAPGAYIEGPQEDFGDSANPLWSLYGKLAEKHDKDNWELLTDGLDDLLIFVRSLSSTLPQL